MDGSTIANALISNVSAFDSSLLSSLHGAFSMPLDSLTAFVARGCIILGTLTEKGIIFLFAGCAMIPISKMRKTGILLVLSVLVSGLAAGALKELVGRARPFEIVGAYADWRHVIGAPMESGSSFPSGHTTVAAAAAMSLFLSLVKCRYWPLFLMPLLVGLSRCYLLVHYPSDIVASFVIGFVCAAAVRYTANYFAVLRVYRKGLGRR